MKTVALGSVAKIERDAVDPSRIESGVLYVGLENISRDGRLVDVGPTTRGELKSNKFRFDRGHVLYGKLRPNLSKVCSPDIDGICSTDIVPIRPGKGLDQRYLTYYLRTPEMVAQATRLAVGINLPRLSPSALEAFEIPLPPIEEQRRIAAVLDAADALRAKRRQAIAKLHTLTQAIFIDMFGDLETNAFGWPSVEFGSVVRESRLGIVRGAAQLGPDHPLPYVRMNAIRADGELHLADVKRTYATEPEVESGCLEPGDVVFNTRNTRELVGKTAIFRESGNYLFNNNLLRLRFTDEAHPEYVNAAFRQRAVQHELEVRKAGTTSVFAIYFKDLKTLPLPLPPVARQSEFAERIAAVRRLALRAKPSAEALDALFASLQQRAFRGDL